MKNKGEKQNKKNECIYRLGHRDTNDDRDTGNINDDRDTGTQLQREAPTQQLVVYKCFAIGIPTSIAAISVCWAMKCIKKLKRRELMLLLH